MRYILFPFVFVFYIIAGVILSLIIGVHFLIDLLTNGLIQDVNMISESIIQWFRQFTKRASHE